MRRLRANLISTYAVYGVSIVSALVLTPVIVHRLGKDAYGAWSFINSTTLFVALLDLGVGPSVVRFGAHARGNNDSGEVSALASVGLFIYAIVGAASVLVGLALAALIPFLISLPSDLVWPVRVATLLVMAGFVVRFPLGLSNNLLLSRQRWDVVNLGSLIATIVYSVLIAVVLARHGGIALLAAFALVATVVRLTIPLRWLKLELPELRISRAAVTRARVRELMAFSWHNFLIHVAGKVVFSTDVIVVGIVLGVKSAALYAVPARIFGIVVNVGTGATDLLYPAFSELEGSGELARQRQLLLTGLRLGMALMLLFALPLVLIPDQLIRGWIGVGWAPSTWVLALLGAALVLHQPVDILTQYLIARGEQARLAVTLLAVVTVNLILSIVLALTVGIWGVALATVVTEAASAVVLVPRLVRRSSGLEYREIARAALRPLAPALGVAAFVLILLARILEPHTLAGLVPVGLVWVAAFAPAVWFLGLSTSERGIVWRRIGLRRSFEL